jgi:hypothetical protein
MYRIVRVAVLLAVAWVVIASIPDMARYLRIRAMQST